MKNDQHVTTQRPSPPCCGNLDDPAPAAEGEQANPPFEQGTEVLLSVVGMRCGACVGKVHDALNKVDGVLSTQVILSDSTARVRYDSQRTHVEALCAALTAAGYAAGSNASASTLPATALPSGGRPYRMVWGAGAALAVIGFYLGLITLTSDWSNAVYQFGLYGGWVVALALGLGVQVGLFIHMRAVMAGVRLKGVATGMTASGGMSGVAMAICCSHYLAVILPAIGLPFLSGAVAGLAEYQTVFFAIGVVSNILGIGYMLRLMWKSGILAYGPMPQLYPKKESKRGLTMNITKQSFKILSLIVLAAALGAARPAWAYEELAHNGNGVRVTAKPTVLVPDQQAKFDLSLNTHSVALDQDLTTVAELKDDQGHSFRPSQWDGSPPGGHHRNGTLIFPALPASVKSVTLTIRNVADVSERTFTWQVEP